MFPTWRLRLREARVAWNSGRYDEAGEVLSDAALRDFLPAKRLARDVAGKMIERAGDRFAHGDSMAGWRDLATADRLGGQSDAINNLRQQYAERIIDEARRFLSAGQPGPAIAQLEKLHKRGLSDDRIRIVRQVATLMHQADNNAKRGHFEEAATSLSQAAALWKPQVTQQGTMDELVAQLGAESQRMASQASECHRLNGEMHAALASQNWGAVLNAADALLAIAPQHAAAREARRRTWKAVGMDVTQHYAGRRPALVSLALEKAAGRGGRLSTRPSSRSSEVDTVAGNLPPQRALLWVDAVGGFLVCLDDCVTIGQPAAGEAIALPIRADLSRRHAIIRREGGVYVLEPLQQTLVDNRPVAGPTVLADKQLIQLGDNVRLRFTKPHALSATARITLESHHKTQPSADGVLLMADSCVLGPNRHCHVQCRGWQRDVVVYRQDDQVFCRADEPLSIDGVMADSSSEIQSGVRVEGENFSFAWETVV
jgi:hypothetical protein